jgi:uridine kinase
MAISLLNGVDCKVTFYPAVPSIFEACFIEGRVISDGNIELKSKGTPIVCSLEQYVQQVLKAFDSIVHEFGEEEDKPEWYHLLPKERVEQLRSLYQEKMRRGKK